MKSDAKKLPDDFDPKQAIYVGGSTKRVKTPTVESVKRRCVTCKTKIWIDKKGVKMADVALKVLCEECALAEMWENF